MTDTVVGAIIGASGIVAGSVLTAIIGHLTSASQSRRRTEELRQRFDHERREKQTARLVERRASYLNPISDKLESIAKSAHHLEAKIRDLTLLCGSDQPTPWSYSNSTEYLDEMMRNADSISKAMNDIEILRVKNTDSRLATILQRSPILGDQVSKEISELWSMYDRHGQGDLSDQHMRQTSSPEWVQPSLVRPGDMNDEPNKQISYQCLRTLEVVNSLFESIRQSNRRIEEIMSGME